ncbi:MAG: HAMP domain-containing protein, partial [Saprospiraceae bacterium]|nr:HAMP domain-containing protein [Saprospiraceae bacterium]
MNIRNRLTLTYAVTTIAVMTAMGLLVYFVTKKFHEQEFAERLEERVQLTEQISLEKNAAVSEAVRNKFLQRLDDEVEYVITLQQTGLDSLNQLFYQGFSNQISANKTLHFKLGNKQGVGKIYELANGRYAVVVTAIDVFGHTKLAFLKRLLIFGIIAGLAIMVGVASVANRRALRPLETKIKKAKEISASNLDVRLEVANPEDEIGQLTLAFNRMLDRIQSGFEAQRGFVSNASHEMRNPLAAIIGEADLLLEKERPVAEYQETLR